MSDTSAAGQAKAAVSAAEGAASKEVTQTVTHATNYLAHHALIVAGSIFTLALIVILVIALH